MVITDDYRSLCFDPTYVGLAELVEGEVAAGGDTVGNVTSINRDTVHVLKLIFDRQMIVGEEGNEVLDISELLYFADKKKAKHELDRFDKEKTKLLKAAVKAKTS